MKFDLDRAWKEATALLKGNLGLLAVLAGVFIFLPYAAMTITLSGAEALVPTNTPAAPEAAMAAMMEFYRQYWWAIVGLALLNSVGTLSMLALLKRKPRPTVGEALGVGVRTVLPYIAAQMIQSAVIVLVALAIGGAIGATGIAALLVATGIALVALAIYALARLSVVAPVMAIDGLYNPVVAIRRSWQLTTGNGSRLVVFYALILIAFLVVSALLSMMINLFFALFGDQAALFGMAAGSALINAAFVTMLTAVLAAVHSQLVRIASPSEADAPVI